MQADIVLKTRAEWSTYLCRGSRRRLLCVTGCSLSLYNLKAHLCSETILQKAHAYSNKAILSNNAIFYYLSIQTQVYAGKPIQTTILVKIVTILLL